MNFINDILKEVGKEYAMLASDIKENETYVDTGSYIFNALVSGSIFGGVSGNKITAIAGQQATGKTFFALAVVKNFLDNNPDGYCLYFDTESAITKNLLESRGLDTSRVVVINVVTIEDFRTKALKAVDIYQKKPKKERLPCIFVLDSLGMLSSNKEISDTLSGKDTRDMTKSQLIKGAFRMLTLKLGQVNIPMIVTNHVYDTMEKYSPQQMSGGSGLRYAASTIVYLSKSKEKDKDKNVIGNLIRAKTYKSRLSKENQEVEIKLYYDNRGLDRYYGLLQLGELGGMWKRMSGRYEFNGKKIPEKQILSDPEKYFTQDIMEKLDEIAKQKFNYGSDGIDISLISEDNDDDEDEDVDGDD